MARTGENQANQANTNNQNQKNQSFNRGQAAISDANSNITKLATTGNVGVNPWMSPAYLSNENKLQSEALDQNLNATKGAMQRTGVSTGGLNGSLPTLATRDMSLQTARLADQLTAERAATDFNSNVGYQENLAMMPLQVAGAESPYYGTSTSGQTAALGDLTQFGLASYGPYQGLVQSAGLAGAAALGKKA